MNKNLFVIFMLLLMSTVFAVSLPSGYVSTLLGKFPSTSPAYGGISADAFGNAYSVGSGSGQVYKYNATTKTFSLFYSATASHALSVSIYGNDIFVGLDNGNIYRVSSSGIGTLYASVGSSVNKILFAPNTWGVYANQMIVGTGNGIYAVNMSTGVKSTILSSGTYDAMDFNTNGELVATNYNSMIYKVSTSGSLTNFFTAPGSIDGMAIRPGTGEIYLSSSSTNTIYKANADGTNVSVFATGLSFDGGWYPGGLSFSPDGSKLYYTESSGTYASYVITGFSPVPEPQTLYMLSMILLAVFGKNFFKKN